MKKIIIIGAGSAVFTKGLIIDIMNYIDSDSCELALCDIDEEALCAITALVKKMIEEKKSNISLSYDTDRTKLLTGCDVVVTTIAVGGRRAWEKDVFIPRKYGIFQPVGDTMMPGGISRGMRMVPAMLGILKDIKIYAKNAMIFNYSNPMAILTKAFEIEKTLPVTGLCHGVFHMAEYIARTLGLDEDKISAKGIGVNHLTFLYDIRYNGKDIKEQMHQYYMDKTKNGLDESKIKLPWDTNKDRPDIYDDIFSWEIFHKYNAFPAPGDRHITEFFTESFPDGDYYGRKLGLANAFSFENVIASGDAEFENMKLIGLSELKFGDDFFGSQSGEHEKLMEIIGSIEKDKAKLFSVNLRNGRSVSNLADDAVLELPALACGSGFKRLIIDDFPDELAQIINRFLPIIDMSARAAINGDRDMFIEAITMGGYINDKKMIENMVDELLLAHKNDLPQFN